MTNFPFRDFKRMASIFCFFDIVLSPVGYFGFGSSMLLRVHSKAIGYRVAFLYDLSVILALRRLVHLSYVLREALKCIVI